MPGTRSSAATKCISDVPGLVKQTSTSLASSVRTSSSAPLRCACGSCGFVDVIGRPRVGSAGAVLHELVEQRVEGGVLLSLQRVAGVLDHLHLAAPEFGDRRCQRI